MPMPDIRPMPVSTGGGSHRRDKVKKKIAGKKRNLYRSNRLMYMEFCEAVRGSDTPKNDFKNKHRV